MKAIVTEIDVTVTSNSTFVLNYRCLVDNTIEIVGIVPVRQKDAKTLTADVVTNIISRVPGLASGDILFIQSIS